MYTLSLARDSALPKQFRSCDTNAFRLAFMDSDYIDPFDAFFNHGEGATKST